MGRGAVSGGVNLAEQTSQDILEVTSTNAKPRRRQGLLVNNRRKSKRLLLLAPTRLGGFGR